MRSIHTSTTSIYISVLINRYESFRHFIHHEDYVMRFKKNSVEQFQRYTEKTLKIKIWSKVALGQVVTKKKEKTPKFPTIAL